VIIRHAALFIIRGVPPGDTAADREIFTVNGHLEVVSATDGSWSLIAAYRNDTWEKWGRAGPSW